MKRIIYILFTLLSVQLSAQIEQPRIKFNQVIKDSTGSGRIVISSLTDSNMIYSPDFYINTVDSLLILFGDTVQAGSAVDAAQVRDIIFATIDAGLGVEIDTSSQLGILTIQSLSIEDSVYNGTASLIAKGTPLYVVDIQGNYWSVAPAQANDPAKMPVVAIAGEDIEAEQQGLGLLKGHIKGVNTELFAAGDEIWVGATGGYTNIRPKGEDVLVQKLGTVVKANANGSGIINLGEVQYNLNPNNIFIGGADSLQTTANLPTVLSDSLNNYVTISGTETITGAKTFTSDLNVDAKIALNAGDDNLVIGDGAGANLVSGQATRNILIGTLNGAIIDSGDYNIAIGYQSLRFNKTGSYNTVNGSLALYVNSTGNGNIANGFYALHNNSTGSYNQANGFEALLNNTSGNYNTANGYRTLYSLSSGSDNQAYGYQAGRYWGIADSALTTANGSLFLGSNTRALSNNSTNEIVIGTDVIGNGSNSVTIGNDGLVAGSTATSKTILNGNVGIGTTNPGAALDVNGEVRIYPASGTGVLRFGSNGAEKGKLATDASGNMFFETAGTERMRINSSGNVGIGTTSPQANLDIQGPGASQINFKNTTGGTNLKNIRFRNLGNVFYIEGINDTYTQVLNQFTFDIQNGRLGIGTTSPLTKGHFFSGTSMDQLSVDGTGAIETGINFKSGGTTYGQIYFNNVSPYDMSVMQQYSTGSLVFGTNDTERMRIDASGNLGLNVSPSNAYAASNSFEIGASGVLWSEKASSIYNSLAYGLNFYYDAAGNLKYKNTGVAHSRYVQYQGSHIWYNAPVGTADSVISSTQAMTLDASGNLGIGETSPSAKLEVSGGDVNFDSGTLYVDATNNRVGIGKTPSYLLDLYKEQTMSTTVDRALQVQDILTYSGTGAKYQQSIFASGRHLVPTGSTNTGYLRGLTLDVTTGYGEAGNSGSLAEITAMQFQVGIESDNGNAPTVTNITGLNIYPFYQAGSVTNLYGLKLQSASTGGSVTNYYGIYQEDANAKNYFNGNVGIGTTSPYALLHLSQPSANTTFRLGNNSAYDQFIYFNGANDWSLGMDESNSNAFVLSNASTIGTNDRVVVTTEGNVGIGVTPSAKLEVAGSNAGIKINATGSFAQLFYYDGPSLLWNAYADIATGQYRIGNNSGTLLTLTSAGNLGIGTTTDDGYKLDVNGTGRFSNSLLTTTSASGALTAKIRNTVTSASGLTGYGLAIESEASAATSYALTVRNLAESNTYFHISTATGSVGNVGIGTSSPNAQLAIKDGSNTDLEFFSESGGTALQSYNRTSSAGGYLRFLAGGGESMRLHTNGNVGIGDTSPDSKLEVNGSATNTNSINTSSDTINYSLSNIAYTDNTSSNITLTNIKDGGAYTLISTSRNVSTEVSFTVPTGFSIIGMGTVPRTFNKQHIYSFIVAGSIVYVTMGTEN